jgi:hypothetical protein
MLPIDLTSLVATILGISIVLIPVIGLTARFALTPVVHALSRVFEAREVDETLRLVDRRLELQEQELAALQHQIRNLSEARDFERQLSAPRQDDALDG